MIFVPYRGPRTRNSRLWVNRVTLTARRSLPVFPNLQTSQVIRHGSSAKSCRGSSRAYLPIQFASFIHGFVERDASEYFAKAIFASNVYERLGRQAFAAGER